MTKIKMTLVLHPIHTCCDWKQAWADAKEKYPGNEIGYVGSDSTRHYFQVTGDETVMWVERRDIK